MDPNDHEDIVWLHTQLTGHANGLSSIYERISYTIRELQDDKAALQSRVEELEQGNPSDEVRRLRDENAVLHARLATAAKEKSEVTWERDALLRKLNSIKQLIDGPSFDAIDISPVVPKAEPGPASVSSTARPPPHGDPHDRSLNPLLTYRSGPAAKHSSSTDISEPRTDVTIVHDSFGRVIRPGGHSHPQAAAAAAASTAGTPSSDPGEAESQVVSTYTSSTLFDARNRSQDAAPRTLGTPFVDSRATTARAGSAGSSPSVVVPRTPPSRSMFKVLSAKLTGSPVRFPPSASARILSLSTSPRTSEGLSMQYEMTPPRSGPGSGSGSGSRIVSGSGGGGDTAAKAVQKWRIHFARPPKSATMASLAKPVTTEALVRNLELDEEASHSIEALSSEPASSLRLFISDSPPGLAFLYNPILLESPESLYVVEWSEVAASQKSRTYITTAMGKHTQLHTFMYTPRKSVWYYLGERRWNLAEIKTLWDSLGPVQQIAARSSDPEAISHALEMGQMEQLTIELQQVSSNTVEAIVMKKLAQE